MLDLSAPLLKTPVYWVRFLRKDAGDAGIADKRTTVAPTEEEITTALLDHFNHPKARKKPPTMAEVHDEGGTLIMQARVISPVRADIVNLIGHQSDKRQ